MLIGSGRSISILELAEKIKKLIPEVKVVLKSPRRIGEIKYRTPDVSFMKKMLKDEPKVKIEGGIHKTLQFFKNGKKFL